MDNKINNENVLKKTNLLAKFGKFLTPVSFAILVITAGLAIIVIMMLVDNMK